jgi:hypothetical protein
MRRPVSLGLLGIPRSFCTSKASVLCFKRGLDRSRDCRPSETGSGDPSSVVVVGVDTGLRRKGVR